MEGVVRSGHHVTLWRVLVNNLRTTLRAPRATGDLRMQSTALTWLARHPTALALRHLDCGSCNGCEQELLALSSPVYDCEQYGIHFQAWPRHAICLVMTGPLTRGLAQADLLTLAAMPEPAIIAVGDCALGSGPFAGSYAIQCRSDALEAAIRLRIPGCPPSPMEILAALAGWLISPPPSPAPAAHSDADTASLC